MSATKPALPPWAEPYAGDFAALRQIVERSPHFVFQPVEAPSPDVMRVFVEWLRAQGWQVEVIELVEAGAWSRLAERLLALSAGQERRLVVVLGTPEIDRDAMRLAMPELNMRRDLFARKLDSPLLWCGTAEFHQLTWEYAPDLWSIAAVPYRVPLRRLEDARRMLPSSLFYWTGASTDDLEEVEQEFSEALASADDPAAAIGPGFRLAEIQILEGRPKAAQRTLEIVRPLLNGERSFVSRFRELSDGASEGHLINTPNSEGLRAAIDEASRRGAPRTEAALRIELADQLLKGPEKSKRLAGRSEAMKARTILSELGDDRFVLGIDLVLVQTLEDLPDAALESELLELALRRDVRDLPIYWLRAAFVLAFLFVRVQRLDEAELLLREILSHEEIRRLEPDLHLRVLMLRASLAVQRAELELARAMYTEIVELARTTGQTQVEMKALLHRAVASARLYCPPDTCKDLLAAVKLADAEQSSKIVDFLAQCALAGGATLLGGVWMLRAANQLLQRSWPGVDSAHKLDTGPLRAAGQTSVADAIDAALRSAPDEPSRAEHARQLERMIAEREAELRAQGVDLDDPSTWGLDDHAAGHT